MDYLSSTQHSRSVQASLGTTAFRIGSPRAPFKIVLAGVAGVGKTSLLHRIRFGRFLSCSGHRNSIVGADGIATDRHTIKRTLGGNTTAVIDIFDTAGLERYDSLTPNYYANSRAVLLVFDLHDSSTMHALTGFRDQAVGGSIAVDEDCYFALVGNKVDLEADLPSSQVVDAVTGLKCDGLFLTSAKTGVGVENLLQTVIEEMHQRAQGSTPPETVVASVDKKRCCNTK